MICASVFKASFLIVDGILKPTGLPLVDLMLVVSVFIIIAFMDLQKYLSLWTEINPFME